MTTSQEQAATHRWNSGAPSSAAAPAGLAPGRAASAATSRSSASQYRRSPWG